MFTALMGDVTWISYLDLVDVAYHVFTDNGLSGLIRRSYYHGSPFAAFLEAELVTESDRAAFEKAVVERMVKSLRNGNVSGMTKRA